MNKADKTENNFLHIEEEDRPSTKFIRKRSNAKISDTLRKELLDHISRTNSIRVSAKHFGINYSTAKSIFYIFKQTGRAEKTRKAQKLKYTSNSSSHSQLNVSDAHSPRENFAEPG